MSPGSAARRALGEKQRALLWSIFADVRRELSERGLLTLPGVFAEVGARLAQERRSRSTTPSWMNRRISACRSCASSAALAGGKHDELFFSGDLGQRIFQTPFSWKSLGVDVRGRSHTLRINYRTSHQIRRRADRPPATRVKRRGRQRGGAPGNGIGLQRVGAGHQSRAVGRGRGAPRSPTGSANGSPRASSHTRSASSSHPRRGATRRHRRSGSRLEATSSWTKRWTAPTDTSPSERCILPRVWSAGPWRWWPCDDEVIPLQARIEEIADEADLEDVYNTERHLLYVACTRARDHLLVTGVEPASEFLDDLRLRGQ